MNNSIRRTNVKTDAYLRSVLGDVYTELQARTRLIGEQKLTIEQQSTSVDLLKTLSANVDNEKLSDEDFRQMVRNAIL